MWVTLLSLVSCLSQKIGLVSGAYMIIPDLNSNVDQMANALACCTLPLTLIMCLLSSFDSITGLIRAVHIESALW